MFNGSLFVIVFAYNELFVAVRAKEQQQRSFKTQKDYSLIHYF